MNLTLMIGNLTRDPELKYIERGGKQAAVCKFTIAVNRKYKDANGEKIADYFTVIAWRSLGERAAKYLSKGKKASVKGELHNRSYEKDGVTHYVTEIEADDIEFLSPKDNAGQETASGGNQDEKPPIPNEGGYVQVDDEDDPF